MFSFVHLFLLDKIRSFNANLIHINQLNGIMESVVFALFTPLKILELERNGWVNC